MQKEVLVKKEIMFHEGTEPERLARMAKIIESLEVLGFKYEIVRYSQYGTNTPTWIVTIFK